MIGKNYTYKGLNMGDDNAPANHFVLQEVSKNVGYRTIVRDKQNFHGSDVSPTLASGRLFTFNFIIFGDRDERYEAQALLEGVIVPEYNPGKTTGLYTLQWENDDGVLVKTQAQVYGGVKYNAMIPGTHLITGSFDLFAPDPSYQGLITKTNSGEYGRNGGLKLGVKLPESMSEMLAEITIINEGNWTAPVRLVVRGSIDNPKIKNITAGTFYGLNRTCTNLVIDGTGSGLIVKDEGVSVKADRMDGSEVLRVLPGENTFLLIGDDFSYDSTVEWDIFFNDTYL